MNQNTLNQSDCRIFKSAISQKQLSQSTYFFYVVGWVKNGVRQSYFRIFQSTMFFMLRYFNFEPRFKLRWCRARDLFGSQIPVTTGGFELWISCIRSNYFLCKRFAVQTLLWSLEFVIQINLEHDTITVLNLARSWSIST